LLVAVVGNISGKIEPGVKGRVISGILGLAFIIIGLSMHFTQKLTDTRSLPTAAMPAKKELYQVAKVPQNSTASEVSISVSSTEEKEPNDLAHSATPIALGATILGRISTGQDRDMFKFHTAIQTESKIRTILRKLSVEGFAATLTVYDEAERTIVNSTEFGDTPVSLGFESTQNSDYFIAVKPFNKDYRGDYELTVRVEE
jgi:hypothetical protein